MDRLDEYAKYHFLSDDLGDIDPGYPMLLYVCDRFELTMGQRYWLAFLYACTYCAPSVFYLYNEFPDEENIDLGRLGRWWREHKEDTLFQTDRRWIKSRNQLVDIVASYRNIVSRLGGSDYGGNEQAFKLLARGRSPVEAYRRAYHVFENVEYFGRFSLFLYLEAVHVVTGLAIEPDGLPLREAQSSCNGLCYALGRDGWLRGHDYPNKDALNYEVLQEDYASLVARLKAIRPQARVDAWNVETTLCAYKKYKRGKRYPGYYLDRQASEIEKMQSSVTDGVAWSVLWNYRHESLMHSTLEEYGARNKEVAEERLAAYSIEEGVQSIL